MKKIVLMVTFWWPVLFLSVFPQNSAIVQGQVFVLDEYDLIPATSCIINLCHKGSDEILSTAKPGRDGIFTFSCVVPGDYRINIMELGAHQSSKNWRVFDVRVKSQPVVNIKPILLNRYEFSFDIPVPPVRLDVSRTDTIAPAGTIRGLPSNAKIWLFLKTAAGYRIACPHSISIRNMKKWFCPEMKVGDPFSSILAVLVPERIHRKFVSAMTNRSFLDLDVLPKPSVQIGGIPVEAR